MSDNSVMKLVQAEFTNRGPLSGKSMFSAGAHSLKNSVLGLFDWLVEAFRIRWPTETELETPGIS